MHPADRLAWRTASYSSDGENCVEVAPTADGVLVRHSKRPGEGVIAFTFPAWAEFLQDALHGQSTNATASIRPDGTDTLVSSSDVELRFDAGEWQAFLAGIRNHEFDHDVMRETLIAS